jgi:hypothetical protein
MIIELLSEMEQELGFTLQPINRIYGMFFPRYAANFKNSYPRKYITETRNGNHRLYEVQNPEHATYTEILDLDPQTLKILESDDAYYEGYEIDNHVVKLLSAMNWIEVRTPEDLFTFVDIFYIATLLYYRVTPFVHWDEWDPWTEYPVGMEAGFDRLAKLESNFPEIVNDLDTPFNTDFIVKWNKRTKRKIKKPLTLMWRTFYRKKKKLKERVWYSVKLSEFFRDELLARLEFYKKLRKELATVLTKEIRDFSNLHNLFVQYYGSMKFIDLFKFDRYKARYFLFEPESEEHLEQLRQRVRFAERRENKAEYQQEYFFAVREHYKEVIQCALAMADCEKYSIEQRNLMLRYFIVHYLGDLSIMEDIWHHYPISIKGTLKYKEFLSKMKELDMNDNETLKQFLEKLYIFISEYRRLGATLPKDPFDRIIVKSLLGIEPADLDELGKTMKGK